MSLPKHRAIAAQYSISPLCSLTTWMPAHKGWMRCWRYERKGGGWGDTQAAYECIKRNSECRRSVALLYWLEKQLPWPTSRARTTQTTQRAQHTAQLASLLECTNETKAPADSSSPGKRKNWNPRALHNILCCIRQTMQRQTSFGFRRPAGQPGQLYCLLHVSPVAASMIYARQTEKTFCPSTLPPACRLQHRDAKRAWPFLLQREIS